MSVIVHFLKSDPLCLKYQVKTTETCGMSVFFPPPLISQTKGIYDKNKCSALTFEHHQIPPELAHVRHLQLLLLSLLLFHGLTTKQTQIWRLKLIRKSIASRATFSGLQYINVIQR